MLKKLLAFTVLSLLLASCASKKKIVYFSDTGTSASEDKNPTSYEPKLKPDDLLLIIVSAPSPDLADLAAPFNLPVASILSSGDQASSGGGGSKFQSYLIDNEGFIDFPVVGKVKVGGMLKSEAKQNLKAEIEKHLKNPIINMRINNYKVSVLGEVARPGEFEVVTERVTILEAISMAGDLTIYGNRKNVLLIRDIEGVKTYTRIDLTQMGFLNSPQYYLQQNDVLYIEPNQTRVNSSVIGPNLTVAISAVSLLITIITLSTR